jgi:hypothetical protein
MDKGTISLGLELTNKKDRVLSDFDVMFNKNSFALGISGCSGKFNLPAAG